MRQKPVVTISLLPLYWEERQFEHCFDRVVAAARMVEGMHVASEDDIIVLFPADRMKKGVPDEITVAPLTDFVRLIFKELKILLPQAHIQTRTNRASHIGFSTTRK